MIPAKALMIGVAAASGALALALRVKRSPPVILMYHGVSRGPALRNTLRNIEGKHMPVDTFVEHLRILRRSRHVISLSELVEGLYGRQDMSNTVVITFDDGYENNFLVAAPALAECGMPASFFLATGYIGTDRLVWSDRLEVMLDRTDCSTVRLPADLGEMSIRTLAEKRQVLARIKSILKSQACLPIREAIECLAIQLGVPETCAEGDYRFMDWDQVRGLLKGGFEVGAHTISHPILSKIPFGEASVEIIGSRDKILQETGQCSSTFCFPNGKACDFNSQILDLCRRHFRAALSTNHGWAAIEDMFELKRISPAGSVMGRRGLEWSLLRPA